MDVFALPGEVRERSSVLRRAGSRVAFVPTMGALHAGHGALFQVARQHADYVIASIFVNPTQFGPTEDFDRYPRQFKADSEFCAAAGVNVLFCPRREDVYAPDHSVFVVEGALTRGLCGPFRPGHFRGVLTVVTQLLNIVQPDVAVFGQKDAQQARLIQRLVRDLHMHTRILVASTWRDQDGLALSSRNQYLSSDERRCALALSQALRLGESLYAEGLRDAAQVCARMHAHCAAAVAASMIEYIEAVDYATLRAVRQLSDGTLLALCVRIGRTRLIDNVILGRDRVAQEFDLV
jgi:pantoate--beta-alanine ligase